MSGMAAPPPELDSQRRTSRKPVPGWFVVIMTLLGLWWLFIFWSQLNFHSYAFALEYLRGSRLQVPSAQLVGDHWPGEDFTIEVKLTNHGSQSAMIVGALSDCSCIATSALPRSIPAGSTAALPIKLHFGDELGTWTKQIAFLTNDARQPRLTVALIGRIATRKNVN